MLVTSWSQVVAVDPDITLSFKIGRKMEEPCQLYQNLFQGNKNILRNSQQTFTYMSLAGTVTWPLLTTRESGKAFGWVHLFIHSTIINCVPNICQIPF